EAMEQKGIEKVLGTLTNRWFTDDFIDRNPDIVERRLKQVMATDPDIFMNVFRIYASTEMMPWLHEVTQPALIITGELDGGCNPRLNRLIDDAMPNSELIVLEGLKHSILVEAGETVARHQIRFVHG
ncbi:MAG: alpha/beta hydrolase, partial [Pseudomonadota bacterium]|nr:alpha/beta hydrolase [Pseudomonadota bacterium]